MKIGLLGGSFNPIHKGHLKVAKQALKNKLVDEVWIMPCKNHAFKKKFLSEKHRLKMIKFGIKEKGLKKVKINKIELNSKGVSYTFNTIKKLKKKYSKNKFFLIVGTDIKKEIPTWHKSKELLQEIELLVFKRTKKDISSTEIRENIKKKKSISNLVPRLVKEYIIKNNLYQK